MDLSTSYMGLKLKNPLIGSPSPLWKLIDKIKLLEDSGAAAVVLHSLFEEQVLLKNRDLNSYLEQDSDSFAESLTYLPDIGNYGFAPEEYLDHLHKVKRSVDFPVIASLNGTTAGSWISYASEMEKAGADGVELNIYGIAEDVNASSSSVEQVYMELVRAVKSAVKIPVSVKLSTYFSSLPYWVKQLKDSGVAAVVLFNRFYQPDIDLRTLEVVPNLHLSTSEELPERIRWIGLLQDKVEIDLAVTGGVHTEMDVLKSLAVGARGVMMTSAILKNGIGHVSGVLEKMEKWLERYGYDSVGSVQGIMSRFTLAHPESFERAHYMRVLGSYPGFSENKGG